LKRLLLDTHALLWYVLNDPQLSATARALIDDPSHDVLVSPASYWEIAIKVSIGKYTLTLPYEDFMRQAIDGNDFEILAIMPRYTAALVTMPFHHRDPFDRLLVAQALVEGIPIISIDAVFDPYGVTRLW
jgi:PIN domain nuclease of toxin-antitoxin system